MIQQFHFWVYIKNKEKQSLEETFVHPSSGCNNQKIVKQEGRGQGTAFKRMT